MTNLESNTRLVLHDYEITIRMKIEETLLKYFNDEKSVEKHLSYHYAKYLYVIDRILRNNIKFNKKLHESQFIDHYTMNELTGHKMILLKDNKQEAFSSFIKKVLQEAKLIKKTKEPDRSKGLAAEYKVVWNRGALKKGHDTYLMRSIKMTPKQKEFFQAFQERNKPVFFEETDITKKMAEWMDLIDFQHVPVSYLSRSHSVIFDLFKESKFQVEIDSGRIYNSFTSLPRTIRKDIRINGSTLGELDMANAQVIFLNEIVLKKLKKIGESPEQSTLDFITWSEMGKAFEFLNGKEKFNNPQIRESFKKKFWAFINDQNKKMIKYEDVYPLMAERIPQVLRIVQSIKEKDHKKMSFLLQFVESRIMKFCYEKMMHLFPCSLLHDGIYFPANKSDEAFTIMLQALVERKIKCTINLTIRYKERFPRKGAFLSFQMGEDHALLWKYHKKEFRNYRAIDENRIEPFGPDLNRIDDFESEYLD